jgi:hypothetical protein
MITHDSETGWTFTQGNRAYGPYLTWNAAAEAMYDLERGKAPAGDPNDAEEEIIDLVSAALTYCAEDRGYWSISLGSIAGCQVEGHYHEQTLYSADLTWRNLQIGTDGAGFLNLCIDDTAIGQAGDSEGDLSLSEWASIKALAQTDIVEQLVALAVANAERQQPA